MEKIREKIDEFYSQKQYEQAHEFMLEQLGVAIQKGEDFIILNLLNELMSYYRVHAFFESGNKMASSAIKIIEINSLENTLLAGTTFLNIATLYRLQSAYTEAKIYFKKCFEIYKNQLTENDGRFISLFNNISLLYQETGEIETAISYSEKALELILKKENCEIEIAITYTNLSQMYFQLNNREKGLSLLTKAIELFEEFGKDDPHYFASLSALAQSYYLIEDYDESLKIYETVLEKIKNTFGENEDYQRVKFNYNHVLSIKNNQSLGMKLCRDFYFGTGKKMLEEKFPNVIPYMACGLVGMGSECLGFDDEFSQDHDFGESFCIWLPKHIYSRYGKEIQKEYDNLGQKRNTSNRGEGRVGVFEIKSFYEKYLNIIPKRDDEWLFVDEYALCMMCSGEVFEDNLGEFSEIRNHLKEYYPENLRRRKIANTIANIAQTGQYNFKRCIDRKDFVTANIVLSKFIEEAMNCSYLLNKKFAPYYKWKFKGLNNLELMKNQILLIQNLSVEQNNEEKILIIEKICQNVIVELKNQSISHCDDSFLENHVNEIIRGIR